jgi:hypothetical protein
MDSKQEQKVDEGYALRLRITDDIGIQHMANSVKFNSLLEVKNTGFDNLFKISDGALQLAREIGKNTRLKSVWLENLRFRTTSLFWLNLGNCRCQMEEEMNTKLW